MKLCSFAQSLARKTLVAVTAGLLWVPMAQAQTPPTQFALVNASTGKCIGITGTRPILQGYDAGELAIQDCSDVSVVSPANRDQLFSFRSKDSTVAMNENEILVAVRSDGQFYIVDGAGALAVVSGSFTSHGLASDFTVWSTRLTSWLKGFVWSVIETGVSHHIKLKGTQGTCIRQGTEAGDPEQRLIEGNCDDRETTWVLRPLGTPTPTRFRLVNTATGPCARLVALKEIPGTRRFRVRLTPCARPNTAAYDDQFFSFHTERSGPALPRSDFLAQTPTQPSFFLVSSNGDMAVNASSDYEAALRHFSNDSNNTRWFFDVPNRELAQGQLRNEQTGYCAQTLPGSITSAVFQGDCNATTSTWAIWMEGEPKPQPPTPTR